MESSISFHGTFFKDLLLAIAGDKFGDRWPFGLTREAPV